ncbi:MAG: phosphoribosyltransferase [Schleiferiaceae bacterium]|nr:phosphoribosyltransferase [Schleiferiaceae bacterium]
MERTQVLNSQQVLNRVDRMAWEIYEMNFSEKEIIVAGIANRGFLLAEGISRRLKEISKMTVTLVSLSLDKDNPLNTPIDCSIEKESCAGKVVVVVDDVLNSGATLIYGVRHFLDVPIKRLLTAVLVDRSHKRFPINADVCGISLSTSIKEHVTVEIEMAPYGVYLS